MSDQILHQSIKVLKYGGGYNTLVTKYTPTRKLLDDELRVAVKACSVNFIDIYVWQGLDKRHNMQTPFIMGHECAGEVEEVGKSVEGFKIKDRVMCWNFRYGMWTENICIDAKNCYKIPNSMSYEEAAAFPISYITAYIAVMHHGNLRPGQTLYIQTAAGGVGCAAIQIAKTIPDITIIGTASPFKHGFLYRQGLKHCFDSRRNSKKEIEKIYPQGVDIIMCNMFGKEREQNKKLLKPLGRCIYFGTANLVTGSQRNIFQVLNLKWHTNSFCDLELISETRAECGINVSLIEERDPKCIREILAKVLMLYDKGYVKPVIDSIWSFSEVRQAIAQLIERKNIGKVILVPDKIHALNKLVLE